jgi:hypothetical protein
LAFFQDYSFRGRRIPQADSRALAGRFLPLPERAAFAIASDLAGEGRR